MGRRSLRRVGRGILKKGITYKRRTKAPFGDVTTTISVKPTQKKKLRLTVSYSAP